MENAISDLEHNKILEHAKTFSHTEGIDGRNEETRLFFIYYIGSRNSPPPEPSLTKK
jgi:hypothetical protein